VWIKAHSRVPDDREPPIEQVRYASNYGGSVESSPVDKHIRVLPVQEACRGVACKRLPTIHNQGMRV